MRTIQPLPRRTRPSHCNCSSIPGHQCLSRKNCRSLVSVAGGIECSSLYRELRRCCSRFPDFVASAVDLCPLSSMSRRVSSGGKEDTAWVSRLRSGSLNPTSPVACQLDFPEILSRLECSGALGLDEFMPRRGGRYEQLPDV